LVPHSTSTASARDSTFNLVSVLIRSTARITLQSALDSAADQDHPNVEIIVAAASGPFHPPLPQTWNGRALRFMSSDVPLSRPMAANRLLSAARGEFVIFLDDDDTWYSWHLSTLVRALRGAPAFGLAYSRAMIRDELGRDQGALGVRAHPATLSEQSPMAIHAALLRRSLFEYPSVRFDESLDLLEDLDFFIACAARTPFAFVPEVTAVWNAASGESGHGVGSNAALGARSQIIDRIRKKWAPQFERWQADPLGQLDLADLYLRNGDRTNAALILQQASQNAWTDRALEGRYLMLRQEAGLSPPTAPAAGVTTSVGREEQRNAAVSSTATTGQKM
jgi:hypothetical protein